MIVVNRTKTNNESGSVTIEATISLSAFMFAIVTLLTIVNICIAQARVSYALNMTAQEISQYSYLYSLTGISDSQAKLKAAGIEDTAAVDDLFNDINTVYNNIEGLADTDTGTPENISDITGTWNDIKGKVDTITSGGSAVKSDIESIAQDPKKVIFGVAKLAGSEVMDLAKSRLIMEPLAKAMCKKHLVNSKNGDVNSYLKQLGIVPDGKGSYYDGIDFSQSSLFPDGSNEITVNAVYRVKVIALLPIDFSFTFNQTAITHGWLAGEASYVSDKEKTKELIDSNSFWTQTSGDTKGRSDYIRHLAFDQLEDEGYYALTYPYNTDGILYNPDSKEFIMPRVFTFDNPNFSEAKTVDEIDENSLKRYIESMCGQMASNQFGSNVDVKAKDGNGNKTTKTMDSSNASMKIVWTVPQDEGLREKLQKAISESEKYGVTVELNEAYGTAFKTEVDNSSNKDGGE